MARLLLVAAAFIVYGSLYPFQFEFRRPGVDPLTALLAAWPAKMDRSLWRDACVNVMIYFPIGLTAVLVLMRRCPPGVAALGAAILGTGLSASIEMLQTFEPSRTCSLLDVASNFTGTVGGVAAALVFRREILEIAGRHSWERRGGGALLLACCWAGYQLYPFVPVFGRYRLHVKWAQFAGTPVNAVDVWTAAAEWFAFFLLIRAVAGRLKRPWILAALLTLRPLIAERNVSASELLGAGLAILLCMCPGEGWRVRACTAMLAAGVALRELSPFDFMATGRAMVWIPFAATFGSESLGAALVLFRKAFDYGALVWLLRGCGLRYASAGGWICGSLLLLETAQRYLPGRYPEITDAAMAGMLACILWGLDQRESTK